MSIHVPNELVNTHMPLPPDGERVIMKVRGRLVDWLTELDLTRYVSKVMYEGKSKVLYLEVLQAIYGMLVASLIWYRKLKADLEKKGFKINPYDPCVANKMVNGKQMTVIWHVDDLKVSHVDPKENTKFDLV